MFLAERSSQASPQARWRYNSRIRRLLYIAFESGFLRPAVMIENEGNAFRRAYTVETSHIAYAYSWFSGVLLAGGWLGPILL